MTKRCRKVIRYSTCFKLQAFEGIKTNNLITGDYTLNIVWTGVKPYLLNKVVRVETRDELDEPKRLCTENKALKQAYAELALNHKCSEKVIDVANEMFNLDS